MENNECCDDQVCIADHCEPRVLPPLLHVHHVSPLPFLVLMFLSAEHASARACSAAVDFRTTHTAATTMKLYRGESQIVDTAQARAACGLPDAPCSEDLDCCAPQQCSDGTCQMAACGTGGAQCMNDGDCCSEACIKWQCAAGASYLLPCAFEQQCLSPHDALPLAVSLHSGYRSTGSA